MSSTLALFGGRPAVSQPPQFSWPPIRESDVERIAALVRRQELSYYGREGEVEVLEDAFRDYLGSRYALAHSSGTAALHAAYFGLGLRAGDEVLAPTFTFLSTVMPLFVVNATPVLVDAESDTGNVDAEKLERHITPRTKAIVVTHINGHPCDMDAVLQVARKHGLSVVEDCSHAHGAIERGRHVGTLADVSVFSLQASKLVAAGQGGILVTDDREIYDRANLFGHFRVRSFEEVQAERYKPFAGTGYGLNYRMHPLAAALANAQFERLEEYIEGRQANLNHLSARLDRIPGVTPPVVKPYATRHVYYSYKPLYHAEELHGLPINTFLEALQAEGVPIQKSTSLPLHLEPLFQVDDDLSGTYGAPGDGAFRRRYRDGELPAAEQYAARAMKIPPFTEPMPDVMEAFAEAFYKVASHADELRERGSTNRAIPARTGS